MSGPSPSALLMDNHKGALAFWRERGIRGATCLHVDAHLDVSNFLAPDPGEPESAEINCGNFLLPAIREGLIRHLVWIAPPHLWDGSSSRLAWARDELQNWMWLTLSEFRSLRLDGERVEGTLAGARLTICTFDDLPAIDGPVLVDVDVDYFFGPEDRIWQRPDVLCGALSAFDPVALTIAASVEGGYTPPQHRYLVDLVAMGCEGDIPTVTRLWDALHGASPGPVPAWLAAPRLVLHADPSASAWSEAAALDEAYLLRPWDVASFHLHRKAYDSCLAWADRIDDASADYLRGLVAFRREQYAQAEACWAPLIETEVVAGGLAAHVFEMRGKARASSGDAEGAVACFRAALDLVPQAPSLWRQLAASQLAAGDRRAAARSLRRAVALAPDELATVQCRWDLACLYAEQGKTSLAQAELRWLMSEDVGALAAKARIMSLKLGASA